MALSKAERSKIAKNSSVRGNNFQRKVAKILTKWFEKFEIDHKFESTPSSGALRWKQRPDVIGDIVTPDNFRFTIECKKHEDIDFHVLFLNREANTVDDLIKFWTQACEEAKRAGRLPMLAVEKKRGKPFIGVHRDIRIELFPPMMSKDYCIKANITLSEEYPREWQKVDFMFLKDFTEHVSPESLLR